MIHLRPAALLLLIAAAGLGLASMFVSSHVQGQPSPRSAGNDAIRGMVLPDQQAVLHAPVAGIVLEIAVEDGDRVKAGDLLVRMDDEVQQAVVESAKLRARSDAQLQRAELEFEEAKIGLERMEEAQQRRAAREWEVRRAKLRRDIAEVAVRAARENRQLAAAEVELETRRLERFSLQAPWDGVVLSTPAEPGTTVTREDAVVRLVSLAKLKAEIYLPAEMYHKVEVDKTYRLRGLAPVNRDLEAVLTFAAPVIDPGSQTFRCVFTIDNADRSLPAGFAVVLADTIDD